MARKLIILWIVSVGLGSTLWAQRNPMWAMPVVTQSVQNLYKIDEGVYRSAQPDTKAFVELQQMGITEVLNLRQFVSDSRYAPESGIMLHHVKMLAGDCDWDEVVRALRIIKNRQSALVIHCKHGSDRTGLVSAMYRIIFHGWSKDAAIDELLNGGYDFHTIYQNIPSFIRNVDIEALSKAVME